MYLINSFLPYRTIGEDAIFPRRSIASKGSEKRSYGNRSPRTPLGDTSFRTSNQKRMTTKGTPQSFSFQAECGEKSPSRRMTADPADLAAMLRELEEEVMTDDDENDSSVSQLNSSLRGTRVRDDLLNSSSMSAISIESRDCVNSKSDIDTSRCSQKSINTPVSTASEAFERLQSDRRATCDPSDILEMMKEFQIESGTFSNNNRSDRRMTADPEDMAEIMRGLEEEEKIAREKDNVHDNLCGSDYEMMHGMGKGRESICTVDLVHSIAEMLKEHEESNQIPSDILSTVSSFSIKSNSSINSTGSQKALISSVALNSATPFIDYVIPKSTARKETSQADISLSFSSIVSDSNETVGTMNLIANINNMIADNEERNVPFDDNDDDNTMMTVSSFGSIGGLLNMVTAEFKESHFETTVLQSDGASQGLSSDFSPRRSKRLSGGNTSDAENMYLSKGGILNDI